MGGRTRGLLMLAASLAVLFAVYVGVAWFVGRQLPAHAEVAGVHVGGLGTAEAEQRLARHLTELESAPVTLDVAGTPTTLVPADSGLHLDVGRTLQGTTGFSLHPAEVWNRLTGGREYPLVGRVDTGTLADALGPVAAQVDRPMVQGQITFDGGQVHVQRSVEGRTLDVSATVRAVAAAWPQSREATAVVDVQAPEVPADEVDRLVEEVADRAVAAPLDLIAGDRRITLPVERFAPALRMTTQGSTMVLSFDQAVFTPVVAEAFAPMLTEPVDAGLRVVGDRVEVVPASDGRVLRGDLTAQNAAAVLTRTDRRVAAVAITGRQPALTTETVASWNVRRRLATTTVTGLAPAAAANAARALTALDRAVIAPGGRLSLDARLGPRTTATGYAEAPTGGEPAWALGGGVDQVASALYEAAYRAGLIIEARVAPPVHLAGTTDGMDAVVTGTDLVVAAPAGQAYLVTAVATGEGGLLTLWSAEPSGVGVEIGPRRDLVPPGVPVQQAAPGCVPDAGEPGFRVTVTRTRAGTDSVGGDGGGRESQEVGYRPRQPVLCLPQTAGPTG